MYLNTNIIFDHLNKYFSVTCLGRKAENLVLHRPLFWRHGMSYENDHVYVCQSGQMPPIPGSTSCLIICIGGRMPARFPLHRSHIMSIADESDILYVFNTLTELFDKFDAWEEQLRNILDTNASIAEMVRITAALLDNPISLCNNRLEIEAIAGAEELEETNRLGLVPEKLYNIFHDSHSENIARHEPFSYEIMGILTYSINLYKQGTYLGLITMGALHHPLTNADKAVFRYFFQYVSRAAENQHNVISGQFVTIKSVAHDLLSGLSVNDATIQRALEKEFYDEPGGWYCAAILPAKEISTFSAAYISSLVESRIPGSFALYFEPYILAYIPAKNGVAAVYESLAQTLSPIHAQAGISDYFEDIRKLHMYYRQAANALELGISATDEKLLYPFFDYALIYALHNSPGELPLECVIPKGLQTLWDESCKADNVDYWKTLKIYLDNEMNAAQTARILFIHRTTLHARLKKITELVPLDTPEQRFYTRYCIFLYEYTHALNCR